MTPLFLLAPLAAASAPAAAAEVIATPSFQSVHLVGGGEVVLRVGPAQRVTLLEGSTVRTRFRVLADGKLVIKTCVSICPRGYKLRVAIEAPAVPGLAVSRGGQIRALAGFPVQDQVSAALHRGGRIDARAVPARDVSAVLSGGGQILVWAERSLHAAIARGGHIGYRGRPAISSAVHAGILSPLK